MAQPTPYDRGFSFTDFQASSPSTPLPGPQVDARRAYREPRLGRVKDDD